MSGSPFVLATRQLQIVGPWLGQGWPNAIRDREKMVRMVSGPNRCLERPEFWPVSQPSSRCGQTESCRLPPVRNRPGRRAWGRSSCGRRGLFESSCENQSLSCLLQKPRPGGATAHRAGLKIYCRVASSILDCAISNRASCLVLHGGLSHARRTPSGPVRITRQCPALSCWISYRVCCRFSYSFIFLPFLSHWFHNTRPGGATANRAGRKCSVIECLFFRALAAGIPAGICCHTVADVPIIRD